MQQVPLQPQHFHGCQDLDFAADGTVQPWRVNLKDKELYDPGLLDQAACPSGVRIVIKSNTSKLRLTTMPLSGFAPYDFDLTCDGTRIGSVCKKPVIDLGNDGKKFAGVVDGAAFMGQMRDWNKQMMTAAKQGKPKDDHVVEFDSIPAGEHVLELWLSNVGAQKVRKLEIDAGASCEPVRDHRPRLLTHGSSITHGMGLDVNQFPGLPYGTGSAHSPSRTWPATAARIADVNLISLGFGGQCHMDQMMARQIAGTQADCIALKLGINVHNMGDMGVRSFGQAAIGFIQTIREGGLHAKTPLLIISPIHGGWREDLSQSATGLTAPEKSDPRFPTLKQMRSELSRVVDLLKARGDTNLHYLSGLEMLGEKELPMMADQLHPNGDGYEMMGERLAKAAFGPGGCLIANRASAAKL